jgi:acyl-coenzyme A synthetase/AMP-(fatty) acid ligase
MFDKVFQAFAGNRCIVDGDRALTYAETLDLGRSLIAGLPEARSLVVLRCSVSAESIAAYVALMHAGHVPLLLEAELSETLSDQIYATYRPNAIVDPVAGSVTVTDAPPAELHPELALLLTTSGSTGSPKLVRQRLAGIAANAESIAQYLELTADERPLLHLPMSYSYGLSVIHSHLAVGASICVTRKTVMEPGYWDDLRQHEATSIAGVPFHYTTLRRFGEEKLSLPSLRTLTQAGGRLDPRVVSFFGDWAARTDRKFFVMYGQTEAGPRVAYLPPEHAAAHPDAIGVAIPGVTIDLVKEDGASAASGETGEMRIHSPAVMMGYALERADLAKGDELGGVLATGDLAQQGEDGLLRIVGRSSRILKVFGLRVNLDEVERRIATPEVEVFCFGNDDKLQVLIHGTLDPIEVRKAIVDAFSLPPRGIEVRRGGPVERTASGKVTAAALQTAWEQAA